MNPNSAVNLLTQYDPNLPQLQQQAQGAATNAIQYQSAADLLPQKLKQAIQEKLNYNQDLISQQSQHQAEYFAAPSKAREQYQNIFNPFQREALVSQATANAYAPLATDQGLLQQRMGNISDLVNAGTGAFNSAVTAQQGQANLAQNNYANALNLAQWLYGIQHQNVGGYQATKDAEAKKVQTDLIDDIRKGANLDQVMKAYSTDMNPQDILQLYNINSKFGPATEDPYTLQSKFGITPPTRDAVDEQTINTWAQTYAKDKSVLTKIPANIRSEVIQRASQLPASAPWYQGILNFIGGL